jgi:trans-aconitate methyltransferase
MSVAAHLGIELGEYDARIRTFIPDYEEMLEVAARLIDADTRTIVDLGIGTGAFAQRCLQRAPRAAIVGLDADSEVLKLARVRLPDSASFLCTTFDEAKLPKCDVVIASFALHHIRTRSAKAKFYKRIASSLRDGGQAISVDCYPAGDRRLARQQHDAWKVHLMKSYSERQSQDYLVEWAHEDVYVPLNDEVQLMSGAGLKVEIIWRRDAFAVLRGRK